MLLAAKVSAQKNMVVYHVEGNVNIITSNKATVAKRGGVLAKNNSLQIKRNSICMLIEQGGKSLQLNKEGVYNYDKLVQLFSAASDGGVSSKFFSYVYKNMFADKKEDKLSITPVVFRGEELMRLPANNTIIISDVFTIGWKKPAGKIPVNVMIWNSIEEKIFDTVLKNSISLPIYIKKNNLIAGNVYQWRTEELNTKQLPNKYFNFLIPEKKDRKKILQDIKLVQNAAFPKQLKLQMMQDVYLKWKNYYAEK